MYKRNNSMYMSGKGKVAFRYAYVPGTSRPKNGGPERHKQLLADVCKCLRDAGGPMSMKDIAAVLGIKQTHARSLISKLADAGAVRAARDRVDRINKGFCLQGTRNQRIGQWELVDACKHNGTDDHLPD